MEEKIIKEENFDTTEVEKTESEEKELSLGKFKDVKSLLSAYNSLQSEFTKRCQKIKELESKLANEEKVSEQEQTENINEEKSETKNQRVSSAEKDELLKEYLLDVLYKKPKAIVMNGAGASVKTPVSRPKTIEEAGNLAKNLLANN